MRTVLGTGSVIGGYRLEEKIGSGGTSVVYRATHVRLGRQAAIKLLGPAFGDADYSERFLRESRFAASLQHPSIVPVYDAGEEDDVLYIAMAYVAGTDLRALLRAEGPLGLRRTLRIVGQIADALDTAHEHGLVHRDVKPANILVDADDRAFLTDFGAVKEVAAPAFTQTGGFLGTVEYAAPEQIEDRPVDARADVYGLACVVWECLAGSAPFRRASEVATLYAHLHDQPPRLRGVQPELTAPLDNVLARGLAKSPLDRFATCGELVAAARAAARPPRVYGRRMAVAAGVVAATALAGIGAGFAIGRGTDGTPQAVTTTIARTLTVDADYDPHDLDAAAYALMKDGFDVRAVPFARAAVRGLEGRGPADPYEGFANFNLGTILVHLGRCSEAVPYLQRAHVLQPRSATTKAALAHARRCARPD